MDNSLLHRQLEELHELQQNESNKLQQLEQEISVLKSVLSQHESSLVQLNKQKRRVMAQNFNIQVEKIDELETEYETLVKTRFEKLKCELNDIQTGQRRKVEESERVLREEMERATQQHQAYIGSIRAHFETDANNVTAVKYQKLRSLLGEKKHTLQQLNQEINDQIAQNRQLDQTINDLKREKLHVQEKSVQIESSKSQVRRDTDKLRQQVRRMRELMSEKYGEISSFETEIQRQNSLLKTIEEQIEEQENKRSKVSQLRSRVSQEHANLQNQLQSMTMKT